MFNKIRDTARTTLILLVPLLLSACGESKDTTPQKMEIFLIPLLFVTVSLIRNWRLERRIARDRR